jgi:hypothetical protein
MNDVLDPFDPASLRLDQTFTDGTAVRKLIATIPVRKPSRQDFVRVRSDPAYRLSPAAIIELKEDREVYLVTPAIAPDLVGELVAATIYTAINRQGGFTCGPYGSQLRTANITHGTAPLRRLQT